MRTTLVIPTYQRRNIVHRLLDSIASQPDARLDVIVVVDGSTDGTRESVEDRIATFPMPLRVLFQPNAGLSAARNAGLRAVDHQGAVWFLDDDMVASPGLVEQHLSAHEDLAVHVVMGPCRIPPTQRTVRASREWYDHVHGILGETRVVDRVELFSAANTSAPRHVWELVGGFFEGFVGWGAEDYELAVRLRSAGVPIVYAPDAVAWHMQRRTIRQLCRTKEDEGANAVRVAVLHPDHVDVLFPRGLPGDIRALRRFRSSPAALKVIARAAAVMATVEQAAFRARRRRGLDFAVAASRLAGVASVERSEDIVGRILDGAGPTVSG